MIRISEIGDGATRNMWVEGTLSGDGIDMLEACWPQVQRPLRLDLSGLKMTAQTEGATIRFIIEGEFMQAGARVLEQCWQQAVTSQPGRAILVDFRAVTFVDAFARELLIRMRQSGARLKGPGLVLKAMFEEGGTMEGAAIRFINDGKGMEIGSEIINSEAIR